MYRLSEVTAHDSTSPTPKSAKTMVGRAAGEAAEGYGAGAFGSGAGAERSSSSSESLAPMRDWRFLPHRRTVGSRFELPACVAARGGGGTRARPGTTIPAGPVGRGAEPPACAAGRLGTGSTAERAFCAGGAAGEAGPPRFAPGSAAIASECCEKREQSGARAKTAGLRPQPSFGLDA